MDQSGIEVMMAKGDWEGAAHACRAALQVTPTNPRLHAYLGLCFFHRGDFATAADSLRRATNLDPKFWQAGAKLAQCYDRLHRYEEAYAVASDFLKVMPTDSTLQGLVYTLKDRVRGNRRDGWERTQHLAHEVRFSRE